MVLKVRAGVPLVWRSPDSLQFGVDEPLAVLDGVEEGTERLVAALVAGISRSGYDMTARSFGIPGELASALLDRLAPVLTVEGAPPAPAVLVTGDGALADELRKLLDDAGVLAASNDGRIDLAVIVAGWVVPPEDHGAWLRRDVPHLPLIIGDAGIAVGPFVEPGSGPCLYCIQLARTDADPAWPAIATQLWSRPTPAAGRLVVAEAAAFATRLILARLEHGASDEATGWRLARDGTVSSRVWSPHPACRCSAPLESDWAPGADHATPSATRRAAADAVPA